MFRAPLLKTSFGLTVALPALFFFCGGGDLLFLLLVTFFLELGCVARVNGFAAPGLLVRLCRDVLRLVSVVRDARLLLPGGLGCDGEVLRFPDAPERAPARLLFCLGFDLPPTMVAVVVPALLGLDLALPAILSFVLRSL